ncbi:agmatinase [Anaerovorax odorimutans]|uniref:Agmatinase n=1 Tax=Anaerovorax odorimutans TaxID=109327 RepID=A0ABT1RQY3_9FIRM|nr:agmatinase [Anaerovorax odorimutans]MCQ4637587.1 agmatinase [Anaerovorax odorimutans]
MLDNFKLFNESWLRWGAKRKEDAKVCIMGIPFDNATSLNKGTMYGPDTLRRLSIDLSDITESFKPLKDEILYDIGDIQIDLNWERYYKTVEEEAYRLMADDQFCLFLGGDHSVTIPLHKAFGKWQKKKNKDARIGIIHFDAHYDLCDEYDGHKWSHASTEARALDDVIKGEDLHFLGIRVAEKAELDTIKRNPGIKTITALDIFQKGYLWAYKELEAHFKDYDAVYFTLDIDVLDPAFAPGTGTPVAGGISSRDLIELFKLMLEGLPVKAMDIVEVAPPLDVNDITSWAALRIIHELLLYKSYN